MTKLSENIRKPWLKSSLKEIKNIINNQTFLIEYQNEGEPVTPCMDVYKAKIKYDGILDKLKLRVLLLIILFISLRVAFSQGFIMFSDSFFTSAKFLGSGIKWETSAKGNSHGDQKPN